MINKNKRIVVTGIGVISPIGIGKDAYWNGLREGKSGVKPITLFDTSDLKVKVAGEISELNPKEILGKKGLVDLDRATKLILVASKFALEDANLKTNDIVEMGISIGTTFGSLNSLFEFDKVSLVEGPRFVNPSRFPNTVINSPASRVAIWFGIKGFNSTISTGFCAGLDAIDYATFLINSHGFKRVMVGAVEEMCEQTFLGFYSLGYLSGLKNNTSACSCPFDKRRDGIIFSEGASVIILEEFNSALERNSTIYAEILGIGSNFDPYRVHKYNPKGTGMVEAMKLAIDKAKIEPSDIDYICANANSTQDADFIESTAIKTVFKNCIEDINISAIKSMLGETYSASGGLAVTAAIGAIKQNFIPPTINYKEKDYRINLDCITNETKKDMIRNVMINSFSPNGANTSLVIGKYN